MQDQVATMKIFVPHWHRLSQLSFSWTAFSLSPYSLYLCSRRHPGEGIKSPMEQSYGHQIIFSGFGRTRDRNKIRHQTYSSFCDLTFDIHLSSIISLLSLQHSKLARSSYSHQQNQQLKHPITSSDTVAYSGVSISYHFLRSSSASDRIQRHVPKHEAVL
jgi:hypothetical protein